MTATQVPSATTYIAEQILTAPTRRLREAWQAEAVRHAEAVRTVARLTALTPDDRTWLASCGYDVVHALDVAKMWTAVDPFIG